MSAILDPATGLSRYGHAGKLVPRTDTLRMVNKINRQRRLAMAEEARKEKEKERKNGLKKEIHWAC